MVLFILLTSHNAQEITIDMDVDATCTTNWSQLAWSCPLRRQAFMHRHLRTARRFTPQATIGEPRPGDRSTVHGVLSATSPATASRQFSGTGRTSQIG